MKNKNNPNCQTLKFTYEEIILLKHALGIASKEYNKLFATAVCLSNMPGNEDAES